MSKTKQLSVDEDDDVGARLQDCFDLALQNTVKSISYASFVQWFKGANIPKEQLYRTYSAALIGIVKSSREEFALVCEERQLSRALAGACAPADDDTAAAVNPGARVLGSELGRDAEAETRAQRVSLKRKQLELVEEEHQKQKKAFVEELEKAQDDLAVCEKLHDQLKEIIALSKVDSSSDESESE